MLRNLIPKILELGLDPGISALGIPGLICYSAGAAKACYTASSVKVTKVPALLEITIDTIQPQSHTFYVYIVFVVVFL